MTSAGSNFNDFPENLPDLPEWVGIRPPSYGRTLSERPCYILLMFFYIFLWAP